ncbi:MAG: hypothetical protein MR991_06115 [Clostridiales bacterium]|nr:hypothetical protein [Clostridiales bacterium]MDD7035381.1 hypothetical protein [Bacillota bacterium]MDY2920816.1 hypothetical protein [Lentihominibacter sp.]
MEKKKRNRTAEKAVKARLKKTHLKGWLILGSEPAPEGVWNVYFIRPLGLSNYLYRIDATEQGDILSGIIPVKNPEDFPEYMQNAPVPGTAEALKPTDNEKKSYKGYNR